MAAPTSNVHRQNQAQPSSTFRSDENLYYIDHQSEASASISSGFANTIKQQQQQQQRLRGSGQSRQAGAAQGAIVGDLTEARAQKQHMSHDDSEGGQTKSILQSGTLLASSYDSYHGGMSSDSELTTSGSITRHGHHYQRHHQRPYSSQSRVYYAHPVPRNTNLASTGQFSQQYYNEPVAVNLQSSSASLTQSGPYSAPTSMMDNQAPVQHMLDSGVGGGGDVPSSMMAPKSSANQMPLLGHQASISSASSVSSSYLAGQMMSNNELPISPIMIQQRTKPMSSSRQLPQRPFKQSMSIDPSQSYMSGSGGGATLGTSDSSNYPSNKTSDHASPAHHQSHLGLQARGHLDQADQLSTHHHHQQQQQPQHHHHHLQGHGQNAYQMRNMLHEMDVLDKQTAELNLTGSKELLQQQQQHRQQPVIGLPPTGMMNPRPSSSAASTRHLPALGNQQSSLIASMSIDQCHQQRAQSDDHIQQQPLYHNHPQLHHQPTDPYSVHRQHLSSRPTHQLPPTRADWLPPMSLSSEYPRQMGQFKQTMSIDHYAGSTRHQQQQQQQYSSSRASGSHLTNDQYHSLGSYTSSPKQHQQQQSIDAYNSPTHSHQASYYAQMSANQDSMYYQQQPIDHNYIQDYGSNYGRAGNSSSAPVSATVSSHSAGAKQLQHQVSDSSSNSNLSASLKVGHIDGSQFDPRQATTAATSEHQKPMSSASATSATQQYHHQSPQHKIATGSTGVASSGYQSHPHHHHYERQDVLKRGYTSTAMTGYNDIGGSQSALSEAGDLSASQVSHSGGHTTSKRHLRAASPSLALEGTSSSNQYHQYHHASTSSHGVTAGLRSESSTGLPNGSGGNSTLTKKSNSATQLSMTGTKKRLGFRKKQVTSFSVHRSEEVAPLEARHLVKQSSSVSEGDSSMSGDSSSRSWSNSNFKQQTSEELASMSFIDGLGKGQMISRQGLTSPYLGDIQLSLCDRRGNLEVEVIRARNLVAKSNKVQPLTYVKLYLVKNRKCLAKAKTTLSNKRTLSPLFQQQLTFHEDYHGCILQSIVWGNFGKMDKKNFMGIAQISIDDLELSETVISWYKLFLPSSLQTLPSKSLRHTLLSNSTESFTNTNNS